MDWRLSARFPYILPMLAGIFLLALLLRLYCLDCHSLWYDEALSIEVAQRGLSAIFTDRFGWIANQPHLYYLLVWLTVQPVDPATSAFLVRLPSALAGALTPLLAYAFGRQIFGRGQGLIAAFLLAVAGVHIEYSQDARPYATLTFLTLASLYCLLMAQRNESARWWVAFVTTSCLNLLVSYSAVSLALPAFAPYLCWLLWQTWKRRREAIMPLLRLAFSMLPVGAVALLTLLDVQRVSRTSPRLDELSLATLVGTPMQLASWFTQLGVDEPLQRIVQPAIFLFAVLGAIYGIRAGHTRGVLLCGLFILVPCVILAILSTSGVVYQRYALFSMPFYFLLVGNGFVLPARLRASQLVPGFAAKALKVSSIAVGAAILALFLFTARFFIAPQPDQPSLAIDRPDFRGASLYLSQRAAPQDMIVFAGWDPTVSMLYWKGSPPANVYNSMDPRLFSHKGGATWWVFSFGPNLPRHVLEDKRWSDTVSLAGVVLLKERQGADSMETMDWLVSELQESGPPNAHVQRALLTMRGGLYQARGETALAAETYLKARVWLRMADEYMKTARGFVARGDVGSAWRETLIAKGAEPENPEVHKWMADLLRQMGLESESRMEVQISEALP